MNIGTFKKVLLHCISAPWISRLYGGLTRIRRPRVMALWMIRAFNRAHAIDMSRFHGQPEDYASLADFFVRPFDPETAPLEGKPEMILSPADGRLTEMEQVNADRATQVKGLVYPLSHLLGESLDFSTGWHVATIYLSPSDYHRFHHPLNATVVCARRMGGSRFPVNATGAGLISRLYVRNERVVVQYEVAGNPFFFVAVGATFVGGIHITLPVPPHRRAPETRPDLPVRQLDELGRFDLGSTIVLAFPASLADPLPLETGTPVQVGTPLFRLRAQ